MKCSPLTLLRSLLLVPVITFIVTQTAYAANAGYVAYVDNRASVVVVETNYDMYTCAEIYLGGYDLQIGDKIIGPMETFGMQTWYYDSVKNLSQNLLLPLNS